METSNKNTEAFYSSVQMNKKEEVGKSKNDMDTFV